MKPNISEFSYGYAFVEHLARNAGLTLTAAPNLPSLIREGELGYDVELRVSGIPLFLQFKLSDRLVRHTAAEAVDLGIPYFRMHLRPSRHSDQHRLLLELEHEDQLVFYTAPIFSQPGELNDVYLSRTILENSMIVKPSTIGAVDAEEHYLAFNRARDLLICSKPRKVPDNLTSADYFMNEVRKKLDLSKTGEPTRASSIVSSLVRIIGKSKERGFWSDVDSDKLISDRPPLVQIAYLARTFLDCETIFLKRGE